MGNIVGAWFDRSVIAAQGADAASYLQGQLSADVAALPVGGSCWSLLLAPTGKMIAWLRVNRLGEETFAIDLDPAAGEEALARLNRFKLRVDVELTLLEGRRMVSVRGLDGAAAEPIGQAATVIVGVVAGASTGVVGYDLITPDETVVALPTGLVFDEEWVEASRVLHGIPAHGREIDDDVIPGELGAWLIEESVSWTKGCYTGQELVARVDSRGNNTPRHLSVLVVTPNAAVPTDAAPPEQVPRVGAEVVAADGSVVGVVSSAARGGALALLKRSVGDGDPVSIDDITATATRRTATA